MNNENQSHSNKSSKICINAKLNQKFSFNFIIIRIKFGKQNVALGLVLAHFFSSPPTTVFIVYLPKYFCNKEIWFITTIILMWVLFPHRRFISSISKRYFLLTSDILDLLYLKSFLIKIFRLSQYLCSKFGKTFVKSFINMVDKLN